MYYIPQNKRREIRKDADGRLVSHNVGEKTPLENALESAELMRRKREDKRRSEQLGRALNL
jgi:hypothetical protein